MHLVTHGKRAIVRDDKIPVGDPSPLYIKCDCGARPKVEGLAIVCYGCSTVYSRAGYILDVAGLDDYENLVAPVDHD